MDKTTELLNELERVRKDRDWYKHLAMAYRKTPEEVQRDTIVFLVKIAYSAGEISRARACELLQEDIVTFNERGWVQGPGLDELVRERVELQAKLHDSVSPETLMATEIERNEAREAARFLYRLETYPDDTPVPPATWQGTVEDRWPWIMEHES
jgi:hypothetical protein